MFHENYDFSDDFDDSEKSYEELLNVRAFLQERFGGTLGSRMYDALKEQADKAAEQHGGEPGIIFQQPGGVFASIHMTEDDGDAEDLADDEDEDSWGSELWD